MEDDTIKFELPSHFVDLPKYKMSRKDLDRLGGMPNIVSDLVMKYGGKEMPYDPLNPFYFLKRGELPKFVLNWFMNQQSRRVSTMTRFYRALHMMEFHRANGCNLLQEAVVEEEEESGSK